jgi:hypothetical protein
MKPRGPGFAPHPRATSLKGGIYAVRQICSEFHVVLYDRTRKIRLVLFLCAESYDTVHLSDCVKRPLVYQGEVAM